MLHVKDKKVTFFCVINLVFQFFQSNKGPIEVYLCPEDVTTPENTSHGDSACSSSSMSSGEDSFLSEDSMSSDSFKSKFIQSYINKKF